MLESNQNTSSVVEEKPVARRTVLQAAAWSVPVVAAAVAVPLAAASTPGGDALLFVPLMPSATLANTYDGDLSYTTVIDYSSGGASDPAVGDFSWQVMLVREYDGDSTPIPVSNGQQQINKGQTWTSGGTFATASVPRGYYDTQFTVTSGPTSRMGGRQIRIFAQPAGLNPQVSEAAISVEAYHNTSPFGGSINWTVRADYLGADNTRSYSIPWTMTITRVSDGTVVDTGSKSSLAALDGPEYVENSYNSPQPGDYVVEVVATLPGGTLTDQALVTVTP